MTGKSKGYNPIHKQENHPDQDQQTDLPGQAERQETDNDLLVVEELAVDNQIPFAPQVNSEDIDQLHYSQHMSQRYAPQYPGSLQLSQSNQIHRRNIDKIQTYRGLEQKFNKDNFFVIINWVMVGIQVIKAVVGLLYAIYLLNFSNLINSQVDKKQFNYDDRGMNYNQMHGIQNYATMTIIAAFLWLMAMSLLALIHILSIKAYKEKRGGWIETLYVIYIVLCVLSCLTCNCLEFGIYIYLASAAKKSKDVIDHLYELENMLVMERSYSGRSDPELSEVAHPSEVIEMEQL